MGVKTAMKRSPRILEEERGSALIICVLVLLLLTLVGVYALNLTDIELQITGNERLYKQNFYMAEGTAVEAAQVLQDTDPLDLENFVLDDPVNPANQLKILRLQDDIDNDGTPDITADANGNGEIERGEIFALTRFIARSAMTFITHPGSIPGGTVFYQALYTGAEPGSSLVMGGGASTVHSYSIFGRSNTGNGRAVVEIGFKRSF